MGGVGKRTAGLILASLCEAGLLLLAGSAAVLLHKPLFFASLGPTAYELTETPERESAKPYNVIVGHFIGVLSGFLALALTNAWMAPVITTSTISWIRVWATVIATLFTVAGTQLAKATQPAALATTLIVATGSMQSWQDGLSIITAVILLAVVGRPFGKWCYSWTAAALPGAGPSPASPGVQASSRLSHRP
jgi:hypothetical protein